jgi:hypothetical protein
MPMDRRLYPKDWKVISLEIRTDADWACENCGRPCRRPGESLEALEARVEDWPDAYKECGENEDGFPPDWPVFVSGRFRLTVAHLDHQPANCERANLRA